MDRGVSYDFGLLKAISSISFMQNAGALHTYFSPAISNYPLGTGFRKSTQFDNCNKWKPRLSSLHQINWKSFGSAKQTSAVDILAKNPAFHCLDLEHLLTASFNYATFLWLSPSNRLRSGSFGPAINFVPSFHTCVKLFIKVVHDKCNDGPFS